MQNSNFSLYQKNNKLTPLKRISLLLLLTLFAIVIFMTINVTGNLSYILWRRSWIVLTMLLVAFAVSLATVLFQTITNNRLLTPSIMGFESLFILLQTLLVFFGDQFHTYWFVRIGKFVIETSLLIVFTLFLYRILFKKVRYNINLILIAGVILGTLFRSGASLLQRLLDPNEFAVLQSRLFATFTRATPELILFSLLIVLVIGAVLWLKRHQFDVLALGRDHAISLGINYCQLITVSLCLISILVAISTALVGPLTFLGLMVSNIAYLLTGSSKHKYLLPTTFLLASIALIAGQLILEYGLNMASSLSVVLELTGGIFFIYLILKRF